MERQYGEPTRVYEASYPPFRDWELDIQLETSHLPEEVVAQPASIAVWCGTDATSPRRGWFSLGINLGGRENPVFTSEEVEYLIALLQWAISKVRSRGELSHGNSD